MCVSIQGFRLGARREVTDAFCELTIAKQRSVLIVEIDMKFASVLKSVALASAIAASSSSFAQYSFVDGSTSLTLSQDILSVYDLLGVSTVALAGSTSTVTTGSVAGDQGYLPVTVSQPTTSTTISGSNLQTGAAAGSGIQEVRGSNTVTIKNFNLDVANNVLYADIYTKNGTYMNQKFLVAGADTAIVGSPKTISSTLGADGYYHSTGTLTNLILDGTWNATTKTATGALAILANGLGVTGVSVGAAYNVHIGDLQSDTRFSSGTPAVPEPSTYALMGLGLAAAGFIARRRKAA